MKPLLKIIALIAFYVLAFPPLFTASFVLLWSSFVPPDYLLGSAFFEFVGGLACGLLGVIYFTELRRITKELQAATRRGR